MCKRGWVVQSIIFDWLLIIEEMHVYLSVVPNATQAINISPFENIGRFIKAV